jgi:hypothetical protein
MPGLTRRRLYKPDRAPARQKSALLLNKCAPVALPGATAKEIAMALTSICREANIVVGQCAGYDGIKDMYTVTAKHLETGKVSDFQIVGDEVALLIKLARQWNGGPMLSGADKAERRRAMKLHQEKKAVTLR